MSHLSDEEIRSFPNLDYDMRQRIQDLAECGITRDEILDGFCLAWEELMDIEKRFFTSEYKRGKLRGLQNVARHLVKHSSERGGLPATMAYLRRFAQSYEKPLDNDSSASENFAFFFGQVEDAMRTSEKTEKSK